MTPQQKRLPSTAGLTVIGLALIAVGISNNPAFIGAGALFMIMGMSACVKHRKAQQTDSETEDSPPAESS